jgi:FlaA1/EpsC-like NDP-sugar epimerase
VLSGAVSISQIREVDVADLLGREQVRLDVSAISEYLRDKTILVTGAGGSIGSEIVRQVARFNPEKILLLGRGENSLFELQQDLMELFPGLPHELVIADVQNRPKLRRVYGQHRPRVVFHAAAHKHVPLMEANADQAILNNVGGTRNVAELALEYNVAHFVNISTDKAVNPTSIMGASKRIAEMVVRQCASKAKPGQHFVSVRFGNVLGSRGSVIPIFKRQIASGGPVTLTHPDMKRYFMTIPEAAQLVLQAAALPDNGTVYVLDMGKPVKIKNLAEDLIQLSGFQPYEDIDIIYTGLRPGEKLFEELLTAEEGTIATTHEKIYVANQGEISEKFTAQLEYLLKVATNGDTNELVMMIKQIVPSFREKSLAAEVKKG